MSELAKAICAVMSEVKGVEKNLNVGGQYKGVASKDIYVTVGRAMAKNGLSIAPTKITPNNKVEIVNGKTKVFLEVSTEYLLSHVSGQSMTIAGYGHAQDSGDKAAGKATTYALKYALLYTFLVPTGDIDDTDATHSDDPQGTVAKSSSPKKTVEDSPRVKLADLLRGAGLSNASIKSFFACHECIDSDDKLIKYGMLDVPMTDELALGLITNCKSTITKMAKEFSEVPK